MSVEDDPGTSQMSDEKREGVDPAMRTTEKHTTEATNDDNVEVQEPNTSTAAGGSTENENQDQDLEDIIDDKQEPKKSKAPSNCGRRAKPKK